jgi:4-aminobutyrate aminotransferase-like enzyme
VTLTPPLTIATDQFYRALAILEETLNTAFEEVPHARRD